MFLCGASGGKTLGQKSHKRRWPTHRGTHGASPRPRAALPGGGASLTQSPQDLEMPLLYAWRERRRRAQQKRTASGLRDLSRMQTRIRVSSSPCVRPSRSCFRIFLQNKLLPAGLPADKVMRSRRDFLDLFFAWIARAGHLLERRLRFGDAYGRRKQGAHSGWAPSASFPLALPTRDRT